MQSQLMVIDPNELVIDLAVDDAHVQELMSQIEQMGGMISEVTVWLHDMRIIDGFHRTEAAKRLGWKEISCKVFDFSEEEFWDARILSAKRHHTVEDARLIQWMLESWKQTKWCQEPGLLDMAELLWEQIEKPLKPFDGDKGKLYFYDKDKITPDQQEILDWFQARANIWGTTPKKIFNIVFLATGAKDDFYSHRTEDIARAHDLNLEQLVILNQQAERLLGQRGNPYEEGLSGWVKNELAVKPSAEVKPFIQYFEEMEQKKQAAFEEERKRIFAEAVQERQREKTPAEQARLAKIQKEAWLNNLKEGIEMAYGQLEYPFNLAHDPEPEGVILLAKHMNAISLLISDMYPNSATKSKINPIWLENIELRKKITEQAERIASLERALGSKVRADTLIASTRLLSSTEIEALTA